MARCPKCGVEVTADSHTCPNCGITLSQADFTQISDKTQVGDPFGASGEQALQAGSVLGGRYEILAVIGKGGMGWVYKARDREIDRIVALKVIREDLARDENIIKRFRDEIILARKVTHKNVLRIYDIAEAGGRKFISMPFIEGRDLKDVIAGEGALEIGRALEIARQVLEALKSAHEAGVVHRDLKPQNIMIDKEGCVCVADFGIAKSADTGGLTVTGQIVGTPEYMSPEQAEGKDVDFRSDLYSFGLIFYEMLTGRVPFKADSIISTLMLRLREKPQAPSGENPAVPPWLDRLVMRTLERDVKDRYTSADEILRDIERETVKRRVRLKPRTLAVIAALVVVGAGAAFILSRGPRLVMNENRIYLAILPFENSAHEQDLNWLTSGIPDNLTADLAQSKFFRVMSPERLRQIASEIGENMDAMNTPEAMSALSKATDLDYVVTGSFFRAGDKIRIMLKVLEMGSQEIKGSDKVQDDESELLAMIDDLTRKTKQIFRLSQKDIDEDMDRAMGEQRTNSVKAASEFATGLEYSYGGAYLDAARSFEEAIKADPDFAMAYARASEAYASLGYDEKAESLSLVAVDKAIKFIDRVPPADRTFIMANHASITYNTDQAIDSYKEFVDAYPDDPEGYYKLAMAYQAVSEWDLAVENLREALRLDPKSGSSRFELGKALIMKNDLDGALPELDAALKSYRAIGNKEGEAAVLNAIGVLYKKRNEFDKAIEQYEASIEIKEALGDKRGVAASLTNMGTVYEIMGDRDHALKVLERSLDIKREIGDRMGISTALIKIGHIYLYWGRYDEALSYVERSYEIREELGAKHLMASSLSDLGYIYSIQGDYAKSLEMEDRALALRREIGDEDGEADVLRNIAEIQIIQGEFAKASENINAVVAIHTKLANSRRLAWDGTVLGRLALARGKVDSALAYLTKSLSGHEALDEKPAIAMATSLIGEAYLAKDEYKDALRALDQAYSISKEVEESESAVDALLIKGELYAELDYQAGRDSIMGELDSMNDRELSYQTRCRVQFARALRQYDAGDPAGALQTLDDLIKVAGDRFVRCGVEARLKSASILIAQGEFDRAGRALDEAGSQASQHSLRDLEARSKCLSGKVRAGQGDYQDGVSLATEGAALAERLGQGTYDCNMVCADVIMGAGEPGKALEFLTPALDGAAAVYRDECPARMRRGFLEAKEIPRHLDQMESILSGLGRNDEARTYRAKFSLK
jgi:serine/threonine protein kinase/Tfp pilus assembly protein PilF/predicted negative regulator of RcsB-dependent stress response